MSKFAIPRCTVEIQQFLSKCRDRSGCWSKNAMPAGEVIEAIILAACGAAPRPAVEEVHVALMEETGAITAVRKEQSAVSNQPSAPETPQPSGK